jgi:hypothetical protein
VATAVKAASKGDQDPWIEGHLDGDFYFGGCIDSSAARLVDVPLVSGALHLQSAEEVEQDTWNTVKSSTDPTDLRTCLDTCPTGKFAALAKLRQRKLLVANGKNGGSPADAVAPVGILTKGRSTVSPCAACRTTVIRWCA